MTLSKRPTPPVDSSILQIVTEISFSLPPLVHDLHPLVERRERSEGGQGPDSFWPPYHESRRLWATSALFHLKHFGGNSGEDHGDGWPPPFVSEALSGEAKGIAIVTFFLYNKG